MLAQFWPSYVLLGLGGLLIVILLLPFRNLPASRYLVAFSAVSYAYIGIGFVVGKISDQFFYFLIVPNIALAGYFLALLVERAGLPRHKARTRSRWLRVVQPLFLLMTLFDGYQWADKYALGVDNAYTEIYHAVRELVSPGSPLEVGSDLANYLFMPDYVVRFDRHPEAILERGTRYFILSSKERWGCYNEVTSESVRLGHVGHTADRRT